MKFSFLKTLLPALMFIAPLFSFASEPEEALVLELKDGTKEYFFLNDKPVIKFTGDTFMFSIDEFSSELDNIVSFKFYEVDREVVTSVKSLKTEKQIALTYNSGKSVLLHGISINNVRVYTLDGRDAKAEISKLDGGVSVNLESLRSGVYIIKANNQSFKINKK